MQDDGDAKITQFSIVPTSGPQGTTFGVDFSFLSVNGTGPGEVVVNVETVDQLPFSVNFLVDSREPGNYTEFISLTTEPDPQCDPTTRKFYALLTGSVGIAN